MSDGEKMVYEAKKILIVFFSGTGGTLRIARSFDIELKSRGIFVKMKRLTFSNFLQGTEEDEADLFIVLFPVHIFDAPELVYDWAKSLSENGREKTAALISVSGGGEIFPNTGARIGIIKILENKGIQVIYEDMMVMPPNVIAEINDQLAIHLLNKIVPRVKEITGDILWGKVKRYRVKKRSLRDYLYKKGIKSIRDFSKSLRITEDCNGCGWCSENCSMMNILIDEKTMTPIFQGRCSACMACVYGCPQKAIKSRNLLVLKNGYDLNLLEKRMRGTALKEVDECSKGIIFRGVRKYLL